MQTEDKKMFSQILSQTLEVYGRSVSSGVMLVWWEALKRFDMPTVRAGFSRYIQDPDQGKYPPMPASIIGMIEPSKAERSAVAFQSVWDAIKREGPYRTPTFDDPVISHVVAALGGWVHLCDAWTEDQRRFYEAEFSRLYGAYKLDASRESPVQLEGVADRSNRLLGREADPRLLLTAEGKTALARAETPKGGLVPVNTGEARGR